MLVSFPVYSSADDFFFSWCEVLLFSLSIICINAFGLNRGTYMFNFRPSHIYFSSIIISIPLNITYSGYISKSDLPLVHPNLSTTLSNNAIVTSIFFTYQTPIFYLLHQIFLYSLLFPFTLYFLQFKFLYFYFSTLFLSWD